MAGESELLEQLPDAVDDGSSPVRRSSSNLDARGRPAVRAASGRRASLLDEFHGIGVFFGRWSAAPCARARLLQRSQLFPKTNRGGVDVGTSSRSVSSEPRSAAWRAE